MLVVVVVQVVTVETAPELVVMAPALTISVAAISFSAVILAGIVVPVSTKMASTTVSIAAKPV